MKWNSSPRDNHKIQWLYIFDDSHLIFVFSSATKSSSFTLIRCYVLSKTFILYALVEGFIVEQRHFSFCLVVSRLLIWKSPMLADIYYFSWLLFKLSFLIICSRPCAYFQTTILDGKTGKPLLENPIIDTIGSQASTPLIRTEGYGNDIFLYWSSNCKGFEGNSSEFSFKKG